MRKMIIILILPFLTGCGTFFARTGWRHEGSGIPRFYPATYIDGALIVSPTNQHNEGRDSYSRRIGLFGLGLLDLPFSLVSDTLCIPWDIWNYQPRDQTWDEDKIEQQRAIRDSNLIKQNKSSEAAQATDRKLADPSR